MPATFDPIALLPQLGKSKIGFLPGEATFINDGGINQSSGEDSARKEPEKEPAFGHFNEQSIYSYSDEELGRKKEVNSMGSRLYVLRLSNHLSLHQI